MQRPSKCSKFLTECENIFWEERGDEREKKWGGLMRGEKERQIWTYGRVLYLSAVGYIARHYWTITPVGCLNISAKNVPRRSIKNSGKNKSIHTAESLSVNLIWAICDLLVIDFQGLHTCIKSLTASVSPTRGRESLTSSQTRPSGGPIFSRTPTSAASISPTEAT